MVEVLLVGGMADGGRFTLQDNNVPPVLYTYEEPALTVGEYCDGELRLPRTARYRQEKIAGITRVFKIFVEDSLSPDDLIEKLIGGYRVVDAGINS